MYKTTCYAHMLGWLASFSYLLLLIPVRKIIYNYHDWFVIINLQWKVTAHKFCWILWEVTFCHYQALSYIRSWYQSQLSCGKLAIDWRTCDWLDRSQLFIRRGPAERKIISEWESTYQMLQRLFPGLSQSWADHGWTALHNGHSWC